MSGEKKSKRYMALFEFQKTSMPNAPGALLNFKKGEFVYRYDKKTVDNQEWFFGRNDRQKEGWWPAALVQRSRPTRASISSMSSQNLLQSENSLSSIDLKATAASPSPTLEKSKSRKSLDAKDEVLDVIKVVRGSQDYVATGGEGLSFLKDEIIAVYADDGGTSMGYNVKGEMGSFPSKFGVVIHKLSDKNAFLGRKILKKNRSKQPPTIRTAASSKRLLEGGPESTARNKIVREILMTEQAYSKNMDEVINGYKLPLEKVPGDWKKTSEILFQNIETIRALSKRLLQYLDEMVESWKSLTSSVSAPFLEIGPFLVAYEEYASRFERAQKTLDDETSRNAAFANFLKASKAELPLSALLVMPVQRMPRYKLLLADLLRKTAESHPDYAGLKSAVSMVSVLAMGINEKIRSSEKTQELLEQGRDKEQLAKFVTKDRTVLLSCKDTEIKVEQAKSSLGVGKLKADVYILSDSLLILMRRHVKTDVYPWIDDFSHLFWPSKLLYVKKTMTSVNVGGPLFGLTLKMKKGEKEFASLLEKEIQKHRGPGDANVRTGVYSFHTSGVKYDGQWTGSVSGVFMHGQGGIGMGLGMVYKGEFKNNEITGQGVMKLPSGDKLSGTFKSGLLHGKGEVEYANRDKFKGDFVNGLKEGRGVFTSESLTYDGEWRDDNAHGRGKLTVGACVYNGQFDEGTFWSGEYTAADGSVFNGAQFFNFNLLDGKGSVRHADGSFFQGSFKLGIKEGEGRQEYPDGSLLSGTWKHDLPNGNLVWKGGPTQWLKSYTGTYVDGKPSAKNAEAVFADGSRFVGSFKLGRIDKGELTLPDGAVVTGKFKNGKLTGKGTMLSRDADEMFEGTVDRNRIPVKDKFMPIPLPATRPSFPVNIGQGALLKSEGNGAADVTGGGSVRLAASTGFSLSAEKQSPRVTHSPRSLTKSSRK